jgi:membrane-associated phospholipid phosphatase
MWVRIWPLAAFNLIALPAEIFRAVADNLVLPVHEHFSLIEQIVFTTWPTQALQSVFLFPPLQYTSIYIYASWFLLPIMAAVPLLFAAPHKYWKLLGLMAVTYYAGMPFYALFPLAPPWLHDTHIVHVVTSVFPWSSGKDANPYASIPSMHVAIPAAAALWYGWRHPWGRVMWGYTALMSITVIYTGDHYIADIAGGLLLAWAVYALARRLDLPVLQERDRKRIDPLAILLPVGAADRQAEAA